MSTKLASEKKVEGVKSTAMALLEPAGSAGLTPYPSGHLLPDCQLPGSTSLPKAFLQSLSADCSKK